MIVAIVVVFVGLPHDTMQLHMNGTLIVLVVIVLVVVVVVVVAGVEVVL